MRRGCRVLYGCFKVRVLPDCKNKIMKNEKYWNGFLLGFFVGGIVGIIILYLVQRGIL